MILVSVCDEEIVEPISAKHLSDKGARAPAIGVSGVDHGEATTELAIDVLVRAGQHF